MLRERLVQWGASVDGALESLYCEEEYYLQLVREFVADQRFDKLETAMGAHEYGEAYLLSHQLAVRSRPLGLVPLACALSLFSDKLRTNGCKEAVEVYPKVREKVLELREMVRREGSSE